MAKPTPLELAWEATTDGDRAFGGFAYESYHNAMREWAAHYDMGFVQTVEAFAALSPNNDYHGNLRSLSSVMQSLLDGQQYPVSTYKACAYRAASYLSGDVSFLDTVKGPKITSFRDNILYVRESKRVTVDGHMLCVWAGTDMTMKEAAAFLAGENYHQIEADFRRLSRRTKVAPCELQATLWYSRKRLRGVKLDPQMDLFSGMTRWDRPAHPKDYPPFPISDTKEPDHVHKT